MAKLSFELEKHQLPSRPDVSICELHFEGFVDASTIQSFEKALEGGTAVGARHLIVDFAKVEYINSSGISALLRANETIAQRGGIVCIVGAPRPVRVSFELLGVTSVLGFADNAAAAFETILEAERRTPAEALARARQGAPDRARRIKARRVRARGASSSAPRRRVLVIVPARTRFTNVLERRFTRYTASDYYFLPNAADALESFDSIQPDLIVVDDRCDPDGEMVSRIKLQAERSLTSIIKTYRRGTDLDGLLDFKIWENDYLVDPFEVGDFFALTEAELDRVPKDRKVFHQQVRAEFRTKTPNVEKAHALLDRVVRDALRREDDRSAFFAAVKEGIDNAIRHGNHSSPDKRVDVNCLVDQRKITVIIEDEGSGFDFDWYLSRVAGQEAFEEAKRRIVDEGLRGGLGILLMSRCADRIEYSGAGNILRLEKNR